MADGTNLTNAANINELHMLLDKMLGEATHRGVYAAINLTFSVADGIIQAGSVQGEVVKQFRPHTAVKK